MSASSESPPNPAVLAVFTTAAFFAGVIGTWGFTSLILDRDVIDYPDAGILLGPAMVVAACGTVFARTWRAGRSAPAGYGGITALATYGMVVVVGALGYSFVRADFAVIPGAVLHFAISPFVVGAAVLSGVVVGGAGVVARRPRG